MKNLLSRVMFIFSMVILSVNANEKLDVLTPIKGGVQDKVYSKNFPKLTVSTFNIAAGRVGKLEKIAEGITALNSDITAIVEIDDKTNRSGKVDQLKLLKNKTGLYGQFAKSIDFDDGEYGVAIMSKYPIGKTEIINIPSAAEQVVLFAAEIKVPTFDSPIIFINAHFDWYADPALRIKQAYAVNDYILGNSNSIFENISSRLVVLAGDFNAVPGSEPIEELSKYWTLVNQQGLDIKTWPTDNPIVAIDHIFTSNAQKWKTEQLSIPQNNKAYWKNLSDHLPVTAKLTLLEQ